MNRIGIKTREEVRNARGGIDFHKAVRQTLMVSRFVKERALKCKKQETPVKCCAPINVDKPGDVTKSCNAQLTLNKCAIGTGPKDFGLFGLDQKSFVGTACVTPERFFCLPFFNLQVAPDPTAPSQHDEDAAEFLFVHRFKLIS